MRSIGVAVEHVGSGDLSWAVLVDGKVVLNGLTRTEAVQQRMRLSWSLPAQRAAARERITGTCD